GLSGTGGIGFSYGTSSVKTTDDGKSQSSIGSTVGSTQGNVTLNAGNKLAVGRPQRRGPPPEVPPPRGVAWGGAAGGGWGPPV
ncbi:MAG: hypothetical protein N6V49_11745, partial [Serratia symbiotica]|nr:hypothetical protein [Serratia symbiotica]